MSLSRGCTRRSRTWTFLSPSPSIRTPVRTTTHPTLSHILTRPHYAPPTHHDWIALTEPGATTFDVILDGIFGFSFDSSSSIRAPFDHVIADLVATEIPVASIDIPSGWDVEKGDVRNLGLMPNMLISLTAPKLSSKFFSGDHHFLGGRFVPPHIAEKYDLQDLPPYPGTDQIVRLEPHTYVDDDVERLHAESGHEL